MYTNHHLSEQENVSAMIPSVRLFNTPPLGAANLVRGFLFISGAFILLLLVHTKDGIYLDDVYTKWEEYVNVSNDKSTNVSQNDLKYILFWNPYFNDPSYSLEKV